MNKSNAKKKEKKNIVNGRIYIQATFNNTIISATDSSGNVICWSSSGSMGFKGVKKSTPFAAQMVAETVVKKAKDMGLQRAEVYVKGPGVGRESAIRAVINLEVEIIALHDRTPIPHNGCRPKKVRRP